MNTMQRAIRAGFVAAFCAISACTSLTSPQESDLAQARQRWAMSNIRSYVFTASASCFCGPEPLRPVTVSVTNGIVTSRVYADTGEPVPAASSRFSTVEALFDLVQSALAEHADQVDAKYDPALGVPVAISIDGRFGIADDEISYGVRDFHAR